MSRSSFVVYYGHDARQIPRLQESELLILEPQGWSDEQLVELKSNGSKLIGYLSLLAWPDWRGPTKWWWGRKERDPQWSAWWMSLSSPGWKRQAQNLLNSLHPLLDGVFFDNLDRLQQDQTSLKPLQALLKKLRKERPQALLIGNRGFAHWHALAPYLDGILFENLTDQAFSKHDLAWVEEQLLQLQGTKILALDYANRRQEAVAQRLCQKFPGMAYYCAPDESLQSLSLES